ncbi:MAG: hypothetical protein CEN91_312 [Candidatus Berkelbacteria bacterium Licking1014_85]|uniref:Uncharacterized protein n=1 Tax=Candidatus Berkelbacteria bacterium Licking1014_85 TaxID=2017148 RepID=A0A554LJF5_9BACT|nr:MAG: hypothetical protein CEN91_312 [Candidatus Berkelbacteria bacterium Licking1014_85]
MATEKPREFVKELVISRLNFGDCFVLYRENCAIQGEALEFCTVKRILPGTVVEIIQTTFFPDGKFDNHVYYCVSSIALGFIFLYNDETLGNGCTGGRYSAIQINPDFNIPTMEDFAEFREYCKRNQLNQ